MNAVPRPKEPRNAESARLSFAITATAATLTAFGVVMIYSASSVGSELRHDDPTLFLRKQGLWVALAAITFALARTTALEWLRARAKPLLGITLLLLVCVFVPGLGKKVGGARRWIHVSGLNAEPSELAKLALIVFAASWAVTKEAVLDKFKEGFLPVFGIIAATVGLIAVEPDMGTASFCGLCATAVLVVAGIKIRHLILVGSPAVLALAAFAITRLAYVSKRVHAFMNLDEDPGGVGYQIRQAVIALGSGGPFGLGLGESRQKRLFLPDGHTDFIFALVGEELGFVGGCALILLYGTLIVLGLKALERARDRFSFLVGTGLLLALGLQAVLNMAVATASIPPKGIALPFVSFGGSSLLFCAAAVGLLARIAAEGRDPVVEPKETSSSSKEKITS